MTENVLITLITVGGSLAASFLLYMGVRVQYGRRRAAQEAAADPDGEAKTAEDTEDELLVGFDEDPRAWAKELVRDARDARAELKGMREELKEAREELRAARDEVAQADRERREGEEETRDLRRDFDDFKRHDIQFRDALGRYLLDVRAQWGKAVEMPEPRPYDRKVLHPIIPNINPEELHTG